MMSGGRSLSWVVAFAASLAAHILVISVWTSVGGDPAPAVPVPGQAKPPESNGDGPSQDKPSGVAESDAKPQKDPVGGSQDDGLPSWVDRIAVQQDNNPATTATAAKPKPAAPPPAAPAKAKDGEGAAKPQEVSLYVVRQGDTLTDIARKDGSTLEELAKLNNTTVKKLSKLMVGQKLKLKNGIK